MATESTSFKQDYLNLKNKVRSFIFKPEYIDKPIPVAHQMPKQKMEPALKKAVESGEPHKATFVALSQSSIIRGGLVGAILTSLIGFNAGKYSRLGAIRKRLKFTRQFIMPNKKPSLRPFTNYFYPNLKSVTKNIMCFSGEQGIGKSYHFLNVAYIESLVRPSLYVSFKASGTKNTFEEDIANKLSYGEGQNPPMLSQIITAVRKIHEINTKPYRLWGRLTAAHITFAFLAQEVIQSQLLDANEGLFLGMLATAYIYYMYMKYPFILQSFRRTKPLVIFDDVNKIDKIGQLAQISRYLQLHEQNMGNVILISSDEETWFKLRKEPGLKDRLRQRIIVYNHTYTSNQKLAYLADDANYKKYIEDTRISPLYTKQLIMLLIKELIGNRQVTIRRLKSILILNDEEQYEDFVKVLVDCREGKITNEVAVSRITDILYNSEMETLCAKLKHIKRDLHIPEQQFVKQMRILLEKGKLLSDNKIGPYLMSYNIVRDNQSEYVFNGKFMYTVFQMAYEQYVRDLEDYHRKQSDGAREEGGKFNSNVASRERAKSVDPTIKEVLKKAQQYENDKP